MSARRQSAREQERELKRQFVEALKRSEEEILSGFRSTQSLDRVNSRAPRASATPRPSALNRQQRRALSRWAIKSFGSPYLRGDVWWIRYFWRGQEFRESSRSTRERDAGRLLRERYKRIAQHAFVAHEDRVKMADLLDGLALDYTNNQRRSAATLEYRLAHLRRTFGLDRAVDVTSERVERYKGTRLAEGASNGTINRELAALRRAFKLAIRRKLLSAGPVIDLLAEGHAREGFVEAATFEAIVGHLPAYLKDACRFAYACGWRRGEVATLGWGDVDRPHRRITLKRANSKTGEPRVLPLTGDLAALIERRWAARQYEDADGTPRIADLVFHRDGAPLGDFRKAWATACDKAGVPGLLFHDLRRSAVRNMEKAGVSQSVAMKITGHKTASVYRRYRIVDEGDMREALETTEAKTRQRDPKPVKGPVAKMRRMK
jgi:integrase